MAFNRFYRFDFAVTQIFQDSIDKYYGVVISAHILAYTPASVTQLLNQVRKPFFVDPMTFVFARDISNIGRNGKIKKSYSKLLGYYGAVFSSCKSKELDSAIFKTGSQINDSVVEAMCRDVIGFQKSKFAATASFSKYQKILKKGIVGEALKPSFFVAPYFYSERRGDEWYGISLESAKTGKRMFPEDKIYPVICMSTDLLLDEDQMGKVVQDYEGFSGYLIWIDNLDEEKITFSQLLGLKKFVLLLASYGKPVYSLYGGFLFDLLRKFGLNGYSSGICYGEKRSVDAVGGGAGNRYYLPASHLKISQEIADALFRTSKNNLQLICDCSFCKDLKKDISGSLSPAEYSGIYINESLDFLGYRKHFVTMKSEESNLLDGLDARGISGLLASNMRALSEIDPFPKLSRELKPEHIRTWLSLF